MQARQAELKRQLEQRAAAVSSPQQQQQDMVAAHEMLAKQVHNSDSLDILSIQRVREFSILIPDCLDSKESALPFPRSIL